MKKKLIQKYQLGKNFNVPDAVTQTLVNYFGKDSPTAKKAIQNQATQVAEQNGEQLHYISQDNPLYFSSNGKLNVRGSEILKRPRIYTHMGWVDPKDLQLDPNKYYTYNDNVFDPTHYVDYTNSDTYTPISDQFVNYIANTIYDQNVNYGNYKEAQRNGSIKPGSKYKFEVNPVLRGYIPGLDNMYDNGNIEGYISGMQGQTALMNLATGFTPAGYAFMSSFIADSGYQRLKNAEDWKDYALGGGEMLLAIAPWLYKGYGGLRSAFDGNYALSKALNKELSTGLDWDSYFDYRFQNSPTGYRTDISPMFNATTLVDTSQGKVRYQKSHLSKHFEQPITEEFVRELTDNAVTRGSTSRSLSNFKGRDNISLIYLNDKGTLFKPTRVQVPEQFPNINFSFGNTLEDYSSLGYPFGTKNYTLFRKSDGTVIRIPRPLERVTTMSDVDVAKPYGVKLVYSGRPYVKKGQIDGSIEYVDDPEADFNLVSAFPLTPSIPKGVNNYSHVYNGINAPTYAEFAEFFPDVVWNPDVIGSKAGSTFDRWNSTVSDMIYDINSPEFIRHLKRELGSNVEDQLIRGSLIRRLTGTVPFERTTPVGDFPLSKAGGFTFEGESGADLFSKLKKSGKINPKYKTEEEFIASLSNDEKIAYQRAKDGEQKVLGVELAGGDWGSKFNTETEEGYHIWDIGNENTPWMKKVDVHNNKLLNSLRTIVPQLGGKEALPRFRWAQRIYRDLEAELPQFYQGVPIDKIPQRFYKDFLDKNSKLYKAFPELEEYSKERFFFELKNAYRRNDAYYNLLEHVVYNDQTPQINDVNLT